MTFLVLTDDTLKAVPRSNVVSRRDVPPPRLPDFFTTRGEDDDDDEVPDLPNIEQNAQDEDDDANLTDPVLTVDGPAIPAHFFTSNEATAILHDRIDKKKVNKPPLFSPAELIGRTYIHEMEDGQKLRALVCDYVETREKFNHELTKGFLVQIGDEEDRAKEIIAYNELCDTIERQMDEEIRNNPETVYAFTKIVNHEGPLTKANRTRNGS